MAQEKIGLSIEDIADVTMAYSLFDKNDTGNIDLESLETALDHLCEQEQATTIVRPVTRMLSRGPVSGIDEIIEETLVSNEDFGSIDGLSKIF